MADEPRLFAREPTPSDAVILIELLGRLMQGLTPRDRDILTLHLQGHTAAEISQRVGRALRTVRRALDRIRHGLQRMQDTEPDDFANATETTSRARDSHGYGFSIHETAVD